LCEYPFPDYIHIYANVTVKHSKAGAAACILDLNLNVLFLLQIISSILSAELCVVQLALDSFIGLLDTLFGLDSLIRLQGTSCSCQNLF
jgi:hypothetical protein